MKNQHITYVKYKINLPKKLVENSKLLNKDLKIKVSDKRIVIRR